MRYFGLALVVGAAGAMAATTACGDSASDGTGGSGNNASSTSSSSDGGAGAGATTGTMSTTDASSGTTTSSGSGGIECMSEYTNIATGECDLLQQNCPLANETCSFIDDGSGGLITACVEANGLKTLGQSCAPSASECAAKLHCVGTGAQAKCVPACCPDNDEPCGGGLCNVEVSIADTGKSFQSCSLGNQCTLFDPNACPGEQCQVAQAGFATCGGPSGNSVAQGDPCTFLNDCGSMQYCFSIMGSAEPPVCRWHCLSGSTAEPGLGGCPSGLVCNTNFTFGFPNHGVCLPP